MKLGIIGKPQSGKTTVFNAAAGRQEAVGDFSQAVHRAVIKVPDKRVDILGEIVKPEKITHAEIDFLDAAGFTGKGKQSTTFDFTPELHQMDAYIMVIDAFSPEANPAIDIRDLFDEMILSDQVMIENNISKRQKKMKVTGDKAEQHELDLLRKCLAHLEQEKPLMDLELEEADEKLLRGYMFLSQKPVLIVINCGEESIKKCVEIVAQFGHFADPGKKELVALCGQMEMELVQLDDTDRELFLKELGIATPAMEKVIQKSYTLLGLISFLTMTGPEVRAWTVKHGTSALKAAGAIHTDMERGFIRAEVTHFDDFVEHKTAAALKAAGKTRLEGKDYSVQDGDVILFRFNV